MPSVLITTSGGASVLEGGGAVVLEEGGVTGAVSLEPVLLSSNSNTKSPLEIAGVVVAVGGTVAAVEPEVLVAGALFTSVRLSVVTKYSLRCPVLKLTLLNPLPLE